MFRLISSGLALCAGIASIPAAIAPQLLGRAPSADYREDTRAGALKVFFEKHGCPARSYIQEFLDAADGDALDWRLLPSIAFIESTGGKAAANNNWFGWDSGHAEFESPIAAIQQVAYRLTHSKLYKDKDLDGVLATYNEDPEYGERVKSTMREICPEE